MQSTPFSAPGSRFAVSNVPPCFRIRRISASVFPGSVKWITRLMNVVSKASAEKDVSWQSSTWNVTLAALIRLLCQREHAGGNVGGNYGVRLTYQYLSVKAGAAAKL